MTAWRMAFRVGTNGNELWPDCQRVGVAGIAYDSVVNTDLSQYSEGEPNLNLAKLAPSQRASLKRFVYLMEKEDVIYVKQGPRIVGKGIVDGPYRFEKK
jgi:hypothetical protein